LYPLFVFSSVLYSKSTDSLKTLVLSGNDIGDEGAAAFAKTLREGVSLAALYLSNNKLTSAGKVDLRHAAQGPVRHSFFLFLPFLTSSHHSHTSLISSQPHISDIIKTHSTHL
jgi:hypothetical protein